MSYHFIVSIGTSLLTKYEEKYPGADLLGEVKSYHDFSYFLQNDIPIDFDDLASTITGLPTIDVFADVACQGAEQKSVGRVIADKGIPLSDVHFHLIATRTGEGAVCAIILKEIWKGCRNMDVYFPEGFGRADAADFADIGLPNLLSEISGIMEKAEHEKQQGGTVEAIIIPTGGYKAIIPYLTIASILYGCPAYYIYEDSETLMELPAPPVGVDIPGFRAAFSLLENIAGAEKELALPYWEELNSPFRKLLYLDKSSQKYAYTAFGKRLREMYTESKGGELIVKATQNRLINRLPATYQVDFRKLVQLGASVWLGDKAPEMADHARYHHLNLFTYAELFLLPILRQKEAFLSSEELMLLLGMIYLHDCGHTLTELPEAANNDNFISLLHSEIRNFHNLLGYYRIRSPIFQNSLKRQGVMLAPDFFEMVAVASLYHRKKMPLLLNGYSGPDGEDRKPLSQLTLKYGGTSIGGSRCALVGALFRIIDGMDKQVARAGDVMEIVMKAESILAELPSLWRKASNLGDCLKAMAPSLKEKADISIKEILQDYMGKESPAAAGSITPKACAGWGCGGCLAPEISPKSTVETSTYQQQKADFDEQQQRLFPLFWEYLTARSRFSFLAMQPYFYYTDILLATPKISHRTDGDTMVFNVDYRESRGKGVVECRNKLEDLWREVGNCVDCVVPQGEPEKGLKNLTLEKPEKIVSGVRDEYCSEKTTEVAQILNQHQIRVLFSYNDSGVSCWRSGDPS